MMRAIRANSSDDNDIYSSEEETFNDRSLEVGAASRLIRSKLVRILGQFALASGTISTSPEEASGSGGW